MESKKAVVLVIEDDAFISTYLADKLKDDYEAIVVTTAAAAREVLESTSVHLIVLDILLPDEDGFSFLESLKRKDSPHHEVPVIILSNLSQPEHVDRGLEMGAIEYLVKANFTPDEVADRIQEALRAQ